MSTFQPLRTFSEGTVKACLAADRAGRGRTQAAFDQRDLVLRDTLSSSGPTSAPMFGHRPVGWGRHAGAVFGATFVSSTTQTAVGVLTALVAMQETGSWLGQKPVVAVILATSLLWIPLFLIVLAEVTLVFTLARALLTVARHNFGAAYCAIGLLLGVAEACVIGAMKGATSPRDLVFAMTTGVLSGIVYWLIASRDQYVVAAETRERDTEAFR